jgi:hypothetical protein
MPKPTYRTPEQIMVDEIKQADAQRAAASAMLAALERIRPPGSRASLATKQQIYDEVRAAIASAKAAGIKTEV